MSFKFTADNIRENRLVFIYERSAYPGVGMVAGMVRDDIKKVFKAKPIGVDHSDFDDTAAFFRYPVFFGTIGKSEILEELARTNAIDLFDIV